VDELVFVAPLRVLSFVSREVETIILVDTCMHMKNAALQCCTLLHYSGSLSYCMHTQWYEYVCMIKSEEAALWRVSITTESFKKF
jgi:hypothetical protein